jgi:hypothetical protein
MAWWLKEHNVAVFQEGCLGVDVCGGCGHGFLLVCSFTLYSRQKRKTRMPGFQLGLLCGRAKFFLSSPQTFTRYLEYQIWWDFTAGVLTGSQGMDSWAQD